MESAVLKKARLTHTTLRGAGLARTVWDDCVLDGVSLRQSDLHYSRFVHAQGVRVDFGGCNLDRANFHAAVWQDTSFNGADVRTAQGTDPALAAAEQRSLQMEAS